MKPRSSSSVRAETRRLRRAIVAILVSASPAALVYGCDGNGSAVGSSSSGANGVSSSAAGSSTSSSGAGGEHVMTTDAAADRSADDAANDGLAIDDAGDASDSDAPPMDCSISYGDRDAGPDAPEACYVILPCGLPQGITAVGCVLYVGQEYFGCSLADDAGCTADAYTPPESGVLVADCFACPFGSGRRSPRARRAPGRARGAAAGGDPIAAYFAKMAEEEGASVVAFEALRAELARHGAPSDLVDAATESRRDEVRHARVMHRWARRWGARKTRTTRRACPAEDRAAGATASIDRPLRDLARENAVEGCVRETFGAMVLAWQAEHAVDPALRRSLGRVAADELRHAGLAWAVDRWTKARLDAGGRRSVARATERALAGLRRAARPPTDADRWLGTPSPRVHLALVERLADMLRDSARRDSE